MNLVLFGPPGAGKGTQAQTVCSEYGLGHLATGNLFRAHISNETSLGKQVKSILDAGELVPDSIVLDMVKEELQKPAFAEGVVFDGFPRTVAQAEGLQDVMKEMDASIDAFMMLDVPNDVLVQRLLSRGEGRSDDTEEKIQHRLDVYGKETAPVKDYYESKGTVYSILGTGTVDEVFARVQSVVDSL
ncbi:MAG: adenylate kinase [Balneolaceae bacterium]|nr:adenylate kinase [Balneolaceae bacterium]MDR9446428.1 adenylate kinase [Balneolaceae bacterium]